MNNIYKAENKKLVEKYINLKIILISKQKQPFPGNGAKI
jgi:hypothetical protein